MNIEKLIKQLIRSLPDFQDPFGVYQSLQEEVNEVPSEERYMPSLLNLNIACVVGDVKLVDLMLRHTNVDPNELWRQDYYSHLYEHPDIVRLLLEDGRMDPGEDDSYSIMYVCRSGLIDSLRLLLIDGRADPSIEDEDGTPMGEAAVYDHLEVVRLLLLDGRANPAARENEAVIIAATEGNEAIVALLMQDGRVDASDQDNEAMKKAIVRKHWDVVYLLARDQKVMRSLGREERYIAGKVLKSY